MPHWFAFDVRRVTVLIRCLPLNPHSLTVLPSLSLSPANLGAAMCKRGTTIPVAQSPRRYVVVAV